MRARRHGPTPLLLLGLAVLLVQLPFFDRWFSHVDEGHMLLYADIVAKGGELYRDGWLYPLPGAFYLLALAFQVFGTSILVARWIVVVEFALFVVLIFAILRRTIHPGFALAAVLLLLLYRVWVFPHWHMYSYTSTTLCLLAAAILAFLVHLEGRRLPALGLAGLFTGLAIVCKQDYGAVLALALNGLLIFSLWKAPATGSRRLVRLATLNGPILAVGLVLIGHFLQQGLLGELLRQTVWGHLSGMARFEYPALPPLLPLLEQEATLRDAAAMFVYAPALLNTVALDSFRENALYRETPVWDLALKTFYYAPYGVIAGTGAILWFRRGARGAGRQRFLEQLTLWAVGALFVLLLTLNRPQDYVHFAAPYWIFLCLLLFVMDGLMHWRRWVGWLLLAATLGATAWAAVPSVRLFWRLRTEHTEPIPSPRGGILVKPAEARTLGQLVEYIQENVPPGHPVAVMPYFPIAPFLADRLGPHRSSYVVWPVPDHPDRDRQIARAMDAQGVDVALYNFTQVVNFPPVREYAPDLYAYLVDHFHVERVFTNARWGYLLAGLRRTPSPPAGTPILQPGASGGRLWVESAEGERRSVEGPERDALLEIGDWPFRPAFALRPSAGDARTVLALPLTVPAGAHLETAVSVHPRRWFAYPASSVRFEVSVLEGSRREVLFSRTLDPNRLLEDRGWSEVEISLEHFAGRSVTLEFSTACERAEAEHLDSAGWEMPRLVSASEIRTLPEPTRPSGAPGA